MGRFLKYFKILYTMNTSSNAFVPVYHSVCVCMMKIDIDKKTRNAFPEGTLESTVAHLNRN